jgi:hypothetical protein
MPGFLSPEMLAVLKFSFLGFPASNSTFGGEMASSKGFATDNTIVVRRNATSH